MFLANAIPSENIYYTKIKSYCNGKRHSSCRLPQSEVSINALPASTNKRTIINQGNNLIENK